MKKSLIALLGIALGWSSLNAHALGKDVEISRISSDATYGTSFLVRSPAGISVVMDPYYVEKGVSADVVTITHPHPDHVDEAFQHAMRVKGVPIFINQRTSWQKGDVQITGIPAMHNPEPLDPDLPSNTIFVVETAGLRIAHFGDLGQTEFTEEQLRALGRIDVAFMQFENSYSDLRAEEGRAFRLMARLHPRLIVPTHARGESMPLLSKTYGAVRQIKKKIMVSVDTLPATTQVIDLQVIEK